MAYLHTICAPPQQNKQHYKTAQQNGNEGPMVRMKCTTFRCGWLGLAVPQVRGESGARKNGDRNTYTTIREHLGLARSRDDEDCGSLCSPLRHHCWGSVESLRVMPNC